ncbi:hypothetical protein [Profundibacter sp.]
MSKPIRHVMLNTNGLRIGRDAEFASHRIIPFGTCNMLYRDGKIAERRAAALTGHSRGAT